VKKLEKFQEIRTDRVILMKHHGAFSYGCLGKHGEGPGIGKEYKKTVLR